MKRVHIARTWIVVLAATLWPILAAAQEFDPAEAFGAEPRFGSATISPDGVRLAFAMPREDGEYVGIVDLENPSQEMRGILVDGNVLYIAWLTNDRVAVSYRVTGYWSGNTTSHDYNSYRAVIISSEGTGDTVTLGPFISGESVEDFAPSEPEAVYFSARSFAAIDVLSVYRVNPVSGRAERAYAGNRETGKWIMDGNGNLVARIDALDYGAEDAVLVPDGDGGYRQVGLLNGTPENTGDVIGLADDAGTLVVRARRDGFREGLFGYDLRTGTWADEIFLDAASDAVGVLRDRRGRVVGATYYENGVLRPVYFSSDDRQVQEQIAAALNGLTVYIVSRSADGNRLVLATSSSTHPPDYYVFDKPTGRLVPLGPDYPALAGVTLGEARPYNYSAVDGTELTGLLFLPAGREALDLPLIVIPPGPGFERLNYNWLAQFLSHLGYAVLHAGAHQFLHLGELHEEGRIEEWVTTTHDSIASAVESLAEDGTIDESKVCILGMGDNGYMAVIGAALNEGQYACAISLLGFVDPPALKRAWAGLRYGETVINYRMARHWRDFSDDELERFSPLNHVDQINIPLLVLDSRDDDAGRYGARYVGVADLVRAMEREGKDIVAINYDAEVAVEDRSTLANMLREIDTFLETRLGR